MSDPTDAIRNAISESFDTPKMVTAFVISAEVLDDDGEPMLLTWWDGGSGWSRLGMMEWAAELERQRIESRDEETNNE